MTSFDDLANNFSAVTAFYQRKMACMLLLFLVLASATGYGRAQSNVTGIINAIAVTTNIIGKSFWPPTVNLFEDLTAGSQVYSNADITSCLLNDSISESPSSVTFYESNSEFYQSIGGNLGLNADVIGVGSIHGTLASISNINFRETDIQGTQLDYGQFVRSYQLTKSCLVDLSFVSAFMDALSQLPLEVNDTTSIDSFVDYQEFVSIYGGFLLTGIKVGARIQVFATSEESRMYSESQFSSRVCAVISLQSAGAPVKLGPCVGFSDTSLTESLSLVMTVKSYPRGGNRTLQAQLSTQGVTPTVLEQFIASANTNPYPVDYELTPLWELYTGSDSNIKSRLDNIRQYFVLLSREGSSSGVSTVHYIFGLMTSLILIALLC